MRRFIAPVVAPVVLMLAVGCSDRTTEPAASLVAPGSALHSFGTPPPPPVSGDGFADIDVFGATDGSEPNSCGAQGSFTFSYEYFVNKPGNNAFLHIHADGEGLDLQIHQTDKKIDAKGTITGSGFSFNVKDGLSGSIENSHLTLPSTVTVQLTGTLDTGHGTCTANATLTASLVNE